MRLSAKPLLSRATRRGSYVTPSPSSVWSVGIVAVQASLRQNRETGDQRRDGVAKVYKPEMGHKTCSGVKAWAHDATMVELLSWYARSLRNDDPSLMAPDDGMVASRTITGDPAVVLDPAPFVARMSTTYRMDGSKFSPCGRRYVKLRVVPSPMTLQSRRSITSPTSAGRVQRAEA